MVIYKHTAKYANIFNTVTDLVHSDKILNDVVFQGNAFQSGNSQFLAPSYRCLNISIPKRNFSLAVYDCGISPIMLTRRYGPLVPHTSMSKFASLVIDEVYFPES